MKRVLAIFAPDQNFQKKKKDDVQVKYSRFENRCVIKKAYGFEAQRLLDRIFTPLLKPDASEVSMCNSVKSVDKLQLRMLTLLASASAL